MNYEKIQELITAKDLNTLYPLPKEKFKAILQHRQEIKNILNGQDNRLILIIGPCSAWPKEAVLTYAQHLADLNNKVKDKLKIVMRIYPQKPRTILGWSGAIFQPDIFSDTDINSGLKYVRDMMLKVINLDLPIAAEILYPNFQKYYLDLLSWVAIGARSSENQEHRAFASALDIPTGLKNPTHGSLNIAINSIVAAQNSHTTIISDHQAKTYGNKYAHLVLRGGNNQPNYTPEHLKLAYELMISHNIHNKSIIIDVNHDNSVINEVKSHKNQPKTIENILDTISQNHTIKNLVKGFMVESFIEDGKQTIDTKNPLLTKLNGLSLTDPCIGWEDTEKLIIELAKSKFFC